MHLSPRQAVTWSLRTLAAALPLAAALITVLAIHPLPREKALPALMVYLMVLSVCIVAALGAVFGACQFGTARAFAAGIKVGREIGAEQGPEPTTGPTLRLVD